MARFKSAALEIYHLDESMAILAIKRGLCTSCFTYFLDKKHPKSYLELLTCT